MIPGAVQRSPEIYLTAEENQGEPQIEDHLKTAEPVMASNGVLYLQMRSIRLNVMGKEGR